MYLVLTSLLGLSLLYMEMALGQYARGGPISAWKITPLSRGTSVCFGVDLIKSSGRTGFELGACVYVYYEGLRNVRCACSVSKRCPIMF